MLQLSKLPWALTAILLSASWLPPATVSASPSVNVAMRAAFPSPPYLVELLETAATGNTTRYYTLLDSIAKGRFAEAKTDKGLYERFLDVLRHEGHMDDEELSIFKLALSMRTAAPRIEAHYQFYATAVESSVPDDQASCEHWLLYDGKQHCTPSLETARGPVKNNTQERMLPFDRAFGAGAQQLILYADITSPTFGTFHKFALAMAHDGKATYRIRHRKSLAQADEALPVNGYGVELALKRTDYIVLDDRGPGQASAAGDTQKPLQAASPEVVLNGEEDIDDIKPLEKSELSSLGMKAASFIMQSESPLDALLKLTQDFPKYSTSLVSQDVSSELEAELAVINEHVPAGANIWFMNGVQLIDRQIQPFGLIDLLQTERKLIGEVREIGISGHEAVSLFGHPEVLQAKVDTDEPVRFDWRDDIEGGEVIIWLNNMEKDKRYSNFNPSIFGLLQTMGSLPRVRKDIFTLIVPVDLSNMDDLDVVLEKLLVFMKNLVPVRFGLVPLTSTPEAAEQAKAVYYLVETYGLKALSQYLQLAFDANKAGKATEALLEKAVKDQALREGITALAFDDILKSEHYQQRVELAHHWVERLQAGGPVPSVFFDGLAFLRHQDWLKAMNRKLSQDLNMIQRSIYFGQVNEDTWIPGLFLEGAATRRNVLINPEDPQAITILDVNKMYTDHQDLFSHIPVMEAHEHAPQSEWAAFTVISDLDSVEGRKLLFHALGFWHENSGVRLDIVHNPANSSPSSPSQLNERLRIRQDSLLKTNRFEDLTALLENGRTEADPSWDAALVRFLQKAKIGSGENWLMVNGRLVGPIASGHDFDEEDYQHLLEVERSNRILPVQRALESLGLGGKLSGPLSLAKLSSITALSGSSDLPKGIFESASTTRTTIYQEWEARHTSFSVGNAATATIFLVAVLNPASELGQKWAPILKVLSELEGVHLQIFLNPQDGLSELPVKRFYRYVLDSAPSFEKSGKLKALSATFSGVPSDTLLIAGMDVPPAWLVSSKISVDDLDNLRIKDIKARRNTDKIEAVYELEHILIEGHSRELPSGAPPRGVQLVLSTENKPLVTDTIIMANLGFFQFKANPGVYDIKIKGGRSSDIFSLVSVGSLGHGAQAGDETTEMALTDFQGLTLYPRLVRNEGMEEEDVLDEESPGGGPMDFLNRGLQFAEGWLGGSRTKSLSDTEHAEINIFSVASGHLYERMLNIMMVSVMRHTKHTVKFWFIEQFLSPSFKDFIPTMAAEYGFKYEMVTYKWPHWLRQQKEKQREIWGYKILFLDVLFPLSLDKVIFVDADQIVRTDMYDLVKLDLGGAPYAFTPMCDSRTEMEGFRFWKTGYWATYLKGKPYHISALYVVDLRRFRDLAAGDRLRQQYHTLSADPNSLSNLDQDLPNHMQFVIPIHSLPQEWLWCETWCSDNTLPSARTIDLCNNPQTKEPKLDRARRQVPEWTVYDEEIAALARRRRQANDGSVDGENSASLGGTQAATQAEMQAEDVTRNPKSRRLDDEEAATKARIVDEL